MEASSPKHILILIRHGSVVAVYIKDSKDYDVIIFDEDLKDSDTLGESFGAYLLPQEITEVPEEYRRWLREEE